MDIFFIENQFCAVFGDYSGRNYGIDYFNDILKCEKIEMKNYCFLLYELQDLDVRSKEL